MRVKELKGCGSKIFEYCASVYNCDCTLSALDEDMELDSYLDTQPGGGNCLRNNRIEAEEYEGRLGNLSGETVFGVLYEKANAEEKELLNSLLDVCYREYSDAVGWVYESERNPACQIVRFIEFACELDFAEKELNAESISFLVEGGKHFCALVEASWDDEKEETTFVPTIETAKQFLRSNAA